MSQTHLLSKAKTASALAQEYAWDHIQEDTHWCGEVRGNITVTAEHIFMYQSLDQDPAGGRQQYREFILSQQNKDGSWGLAPQYLGDVSTLVEAYLALRICGMNTEQDVMQRARDFILGAGGIPGVRMFTRIFLAMFGIVPWSNVPHLPPELILMPSWSPLNIYMMASWARSTVIPLLLIRHHEPVYKLPIRTDGSPLYLDELWLDPRDKSMPYSLPLFELSQQGMLSAAFGIGDRVLTWLGGLRYFGLRRSARLKCVDWIIQHQEAQGDWAGIAMPMLCSILALRLEGFSVGHSVIQKGLQAVERFTIEDQHGKRVQACVSPHWDTVLMTAALCDTTPNVLPSKLLYRTIEWIKKRQQLGLAGDWRVLNPDLRSGGFSFEYNNSWYPDVDDTAATVIALLKHDPWSVGTPTVLNALNWILGMQNIDGGWAAFDTSNNKLWLNKIPFSDMDALCDPSTADVTGRVLEAFGIILGSEDKSSVVVEVIDRIAIASNRAIAFLVCEQEPNGSWFGRWGCNYLYGTSGVLCGLEHFVDERDDVRDMVEYGLDWIKTCQNVDGGWSEDLMSYKKPRIGGCNPSTQSQTAWALMGLLAHLSFEDPQIVTGISYLVTSQVAEVSKYSASWVETAYTGVGFPGHFYFGYDLYRHYFPMMALGRFIRSCDDGDAQSIDSGVAGV